MSRSGLIKCSRPSKSRESLVKKHSIIICQWVSLKFFHFPSSYHSKVISSSPYGKKRSSTPIHDFHSISIPFFSSSSSSPSSSSSSSPTSSHSPVHRKRRRIFLPFVISLILGLTVWNSQSEENKSWLVGLLKTIPFRFLSRIWGSIHQIELPIWLRKFVYSLWDYFYDCNIEEASKSLEEYRNLSEFFIRELKPGIRPISSTPLVSPVDALITVLGKLDNPNSNIHQVKGQSYTVEQLLGFSLNELIPSHHSFYYAIFYLAPGHYHRIHNPCNTVYTTRIHAVGTLFPVHPFFTRIVPNLFIRNERVILSGKWNGGDSNSSNLTDNERSLGSESDCFFSMCMVGAFNVGSVRLSFDEALVTNLAKKMSLPPFLQSYYHQLFSSHLFHKPQKKEMDTRDEPSDEDKNNTLFTDEPYGKGKGGYIKHYGSTHLIEGKVTPALPLPWMEDVSGLHVGKGEEIARFELGSSIVLVFETKEEVNEELGEKGIWRWGIKEGERVKVGQALGWIEKVKNKV